MLHVSETHPTDFERIVPRPEQQAEIDYVLAAGIDLTACEAVTITEDLSYGVVAIIGLTPCWEGRSLVFMAVDEQRAKAHRVGFMRTLRRLLEGRNERRLEMTILESDTQAIELAVWCGFEIEARMPRYSPDGETHLLLARVRKDH
jgi:hypothetical protein